MVMLTYDVGCRSCGSKDGILNSEFDMEKEPSYYLNSTEYNIAEHIARKGRLNNAKCQFCNSNNLEVFDVTANDTPLFSFDRLVEESKNSGGKKTFLVIYITKDKFDGIKIQYGGNKTFKEFFGNHLAEKVSDFFSWTNENLFEAKSDGSFFFCISENRDPNSGWEIKTERIKFHGFGKKEIFDIMKAEVQKFLI